MVQLASRKIGGPEGELVEFLLAVAAEPLAVVHSAVEPYLFLEFVNVVGQQTIQCAVLFMCKYFRSQDHKIRLLVVSHLYMYI
jgi:hypothetical protein